ncbi:MAG TPA: hypothetical protein VH988_27050 [Thermoanaerobaculia bacterium]|jgi:hypothetical protein|nr:hypothetical protein [Thermoanaerobaculia bacterium]
MSRDLIWWLLLAALALAAMGLFIADQVQKANQRNILLQGNCEEAAMVEAVRSYKTVVLGLAVLSTVLGVSVSALLTRRLQAELYHGTPGTGRRFTVGVLVSLGVVVAASAIFYLFDRSCLHAAVASEGGLPANVASRVMSLVGNMVPNFWLASTLEVLLVTFLSFFALSRILRLLSGQVARLRRA